MPGVCASATAPRFRWPCGGGPQPLSRCWPACCARSPTCTIPLWGGQPCTGHGPPGALRRA
eukprot:7600420-Lingulodinium_polyedra.AAC.1